jgi:hypothetical protein
MSRNLVFFCAQGNPPGGGHALAESGLYATFCLGKQTIQPPGDKGGVVVRGAPDDEGGMRSCRGTSYFFVHRGIPQEGCMHWRKVDFMLRFMKIGHFYDILCLLWNKVLFMEIGPF